MWSKKLYFQGCFKLYLKSDIAEANLLDLSAIKLVEKTVF